MVCVCALGGERRLVKCLACWVLLEKGWRTAVSSTKLGLVALDGVKGI